MTLVQDRPHYVYRLFDADDRLLYIGCSRDPEHRIGTFHKNPLTSLRSMTIASLIDHHTVEEHPDQFEALEAERLAIREEGPLLNKQWNLREPMTRAEYNAEFGATV